MSNLQRPIRKSNLAFNKLNESTIIIDFSAEKQFHQTNDVGTFIWDLCDGSNTLDQILEKVLEEYEIDLETATIDVANFLNLLKKNELLDY